MNHARWLVGSENFFDGGPIGKITSDVRVPGMVLETRKAGPLEGHVVVVVEVVETDDLIASLKQAHRYMGADKASGAGDKNFHWMEISCGQIAGGRHFGET
jgi:hypothetical protein